MIRYAGTLDSRHMQAALDATFSMSDLRTEDGLTASGYDMARSVILHCAVTEVYKHVIDGKLSLRAAYVLRHIPAQEWMVLLEDPSKAEARADAVSAAVTSSKQSNIRTRGVFARTMAALRRLGGWE